MDTKMASYYASKLKTWSGWRPLKGNLPLYQNWGAFGKRPPPHLDNLTWSQLYFELEGVRPHIASQECIKSFASMYGLVKLMGDIFFARSKNNLQLPRRKSTESIHWLWVCVPTAKCHDILHIWWSTACLMPSFVCYVFECCKTYTLAPV